MVVAGEVLGVHREALRGADLDTAVADNAAQPVDLPGLLLDLHADGLTGHLRWQDRQVMQPSGLIVTCPRERGVFFAGFAGYIRVTRRENRLLTIVFVISK